MLASIEAFKASVSNPNIVGLGISSKDKQPAILVCLEKEDETIPSRIGEFPVILRIYSPTRDSTDNSERLMNVAEAISVATSVLAGGSVKPIAAFSAGIMLTLKNLLNKNYLTKNQFDAILQFSQPDEPQSTSSP